MSEFESLISQLRSLSAEFSEKAACSAADAKTLALAAQMIAQEREKSEKLETALSAAKISAGLKKSPLKQEFTFLIDGSHSMTFNFGDGISPLKAALDGLKAFSAATTKVTSAVLWSNHDKVTPVVGSEGRSVSNEFNPLDWTFIVEKVGNGYRGKVPELTGVRATAPTEAECRADLEANLRFALDTNGHSTTTPNKPYDEYFRHPLDGGYFLPAVKYMGLVAKGTQKPQRFVVVSDGDIFDSSDSFDAMKNLLRDSKNIFVDFIVIKNDKGYNHLKKLAKNLAKEFPQQVGIYNVKSGESLDDTLAEIVEKAPKAKRAKSSPRPSA